MKDKEEGEGSSVKLKSTLGVIREEREGGRVGNW